LKEGSYPNSPSAFFFDDTFKSHSDDPEKMLFILRSVQKELQRQLDYKHCVTNADLKIMLRPVCSEVIKDTDHIYGWRKDADHPDTRIDLGIYNINSVACREFVNGLESVILLDPNCELILPKRYLDLSEVYKGAKDL
jgi:hypothetical protein